MDIDWAALFVPTVHPLELVLRGTLLYLSILAAFRVFRRESGALSTADLLVVMLVADAAQNGMASDYRSITEGVVLVATIVLWSYVLDLLSFRFPAVRRILHPAPLLLIANGRLQRRHLRAELVPLDELKSHLREQGIEDWSEVRRCYLEPDGHFSVIRFDGDRPANPRRGNSPERA
jgi:uncharacterized membrane protein YcaP (DUF421 family)